MIESDVSDAELDRQATVTGLAGLSVVALVLAVLLLLFPLGTTYDSDCGTILQRPPSPCDDRATHRLWAVIGVAVLAAALCVLAARLARHRGRFVAAALVTIAVIAALILVGAPYAQDARTTAGVTFVLHCPGRFSDSGGQEHPPPGSEDVCSDSADRRLAVAGFLVIFATGGAIVLLRRDRHSAAR